MKQFLLVAHNCFNLKVNVLQGEFTCIWAGTLKGFPFKTSHVYQMLEPELHSSVTKTKPLKTNELDHFIDSETSIKTKCFQGCYFQHWHGLCQRSKCCISHPAIELMFIKVTLQWQHLEDLSQSAQAYGNKVLYWKQLWRLYKVYFQAIHGFWKKNCDTITLVFATVTWSLCTSLKYSSSPFSQEQNNMGSGTSALNITALSSELVLPLHRVGS